MSEERFDGLAVVCDARGVVRRVLNDWPALQRPAALGRSLAGIAEGDNADKVDLFFDALRAKQAAFNWVVNVPLRDRIAPLHLAGCVTAEGCLVVGALSRPAACRYFDDLMRINDEQANRLRAAMKDAQLQLRSHELRDAELYDELAKVNNELVTLQRELAKKNAELRQLNEQKNQFLGMAAHDLRSPLGAITTFSGFLLEEAGPALSAEHQHFLTLIRSSSEFMLRLIDDLLDISKIEAGRLVLDVRPTDFAALLRDNVAVNQVLAAKRQIQLRLTCDAVPALALDAAKMEQVLNNLLSNATRYAPAASAVDVCLAVRDGALLLSIRDRGPGIPADKMGELFTPFTRLAGKAVHGEKSTGLGLAIVRRIVEAHGGNVWAESTPGEGSTFFVSLPLPAGTN